MAHQLSQMPKKTRMPNLRRSATIAQVPSYGLHPAYSTMQAPVSVMPLPLVNTNSTYNVNPSYAIQNFTPRASPLVQPALQPAQSGHMILPNHPHHTVSGRAGSICPSEIQLPSSNLNTIPVTIQPQFQTLQAQSPFVDNVSSIGAFSEKPGAGGRIRTSSDHANQQNSRMEIRRESQLTEAVLEAARKISAPPSINGNDANSRIERNRKIKSIGCLVIIITIIVLLIVLVSRVIISGSINDMSTSAKCGMGSSQDYRICSSGTMHPAGT